MFVTVVCLIMINYLAIRAMLSVRKTSLIYSKLLKMRAHLWLSEFSFILSLHLSAEDNDAFSEAEKPQG